ncbi:MAG: VTT domain-containing protein [candidate division WOR-3 bacterium]|nr:VTT domain-containing protein [candidate division WOR-3 bacterium]
MHNSEGRIPAAERPPHTIGQKITLAVTIAALVGLAVLLVFAGNSVWRYFRHPEELRVLVRSWGAWAPVGIVLFQVVQVVVAPLPGNAMSFAAGYALCLWPTVVWLMIGVLLGATVDFLLIKLLGRRLLRYFLPPNRLAQLDALVLRRGTFYIFLLLLVPNPVGDWVYYLAGLTTMPLPVFLGLVFIGRLPSNLLECAVGASATHFGWREWAIVGLVAAILGLLYYQYRNRIEAALDRLSSRRRPPAVRP